MDDLILCQKAIGGNQETLKNCGGCLRTNNLVGSMLWLFTALAYAILSTCITSIAQRVGPQPPSTSSPLSP